MGIGFTETMTQSWFSRLQSSLGGMLVGIMMIALSVLTLFLNEGRAVKTAKSLAEGAAAVVHVQPSPVKSSNNGKLVHFNGMTAMPSMLRDPVFGVEAKALQISRKVEMYQWKQLSRSTTREKLGGGKETATTYDYEKDWSDQVQSSRDFKDQTGHVNPASMPYKNETTVASNVSVGDFQIPQRIVAGLDGAFSPMALDEKSIASAPTSVVTGGRKPMLDQGAFYYGVNPAAPAVGDFRVRFAAMEPGDISVIGRQSGKTIEPYVTKAGRPLEMARVGSIDASAMFEGAMKSNSILTWVLRAGGFLLMFIGSSMVFKPLVIVGKFIPLLGSAIGAGARLLAFGFSSVVSLVIIGVAWFAYRPLLSILLLALGGAVGVLALKLGRTKNAGPVVSNAAPAP
jgi:hypothetical protein